MKPVIYITLNNVQTAWGGVGVWRRTLEGHISAEYKAQIN